MNLSYLLLAQALVRSDKAHAGPRLGMSDAVADMLAQASPQHLLRVASRGLLLCTLRFDEEMVWSLLTGPHVARDETGSLAQRRPAFATLASLERAGAVLAGVAA